MKRRFLGLLIVLILASCKGDDSISNEVIKDKIFGEWIAQSIVQKKVRYRPNGEAKDTLSFFNSQAYNISLELKITDNPKRILDSGTYSYKGYFMEFSDGRTKELIEKHGLRFHNIIEWNFLGDDEISAVERISNGNSNVLSYIDNFINFKIIKLTQEEFVLEQHTFHSFFNPSINKEEVLKVYTFTRKK